MADGIADELCGINLGDKRLNDRSVEVIEALAANPQASINASCMGAADTTAAYRLFDNERVTPEKILAPHRAATLLRIRQHPVVLIAQDTTELDYTKHPQKDAGCLNSAKRFGVYHHAHLAITPDKLPLGVVGTHSFDRTPESLGKTEKRASLPIEEKESFRWLKGFRLACEMAEECPQTQIISVADREADIYDIYLDAQEQRQKAGARTADYIIRVKEDRSTPERNPEAGPASYHKVRDKVRGSDLRARIQIELPKTPKRAARLATLDVRAIQVTVKPPQARKTLAAVTVNVVLVEEVGGPDDDTRVSWLLITTAVIDTVDDVLRVLKYYTARWGIEIFFRTLKSGCRVEALQLETKARMLNALAFYDIIAWRVVYLTYLNRECPDLPCTAMFDDAEWKSVWRVVKKQPLPASPPTLSAIMRLVSELGGHNNRANDCPAGPECIWMGLRRTIDFGAAWRAFGPE